MAAAAPYMLVWKQTYHNRISLCGLQREPLSSRQTRLPGHFRLTWELHFQRHVGFVVRDDLDSGHQHDGIQAASLVVVVALAVCITMFCYYFYLQVQFLLFIG